MADPSMTDPRRNDRRSNMQGKATKSQSMQNLYLRPNSSIKPNNMNLGYLSLAGKGKQNPALHTFNSADGGVV